MPINKIIGYYNNSGNTAYQTGVTTLNGITDKLVTTGWPHFFKGMVVTTGTAPYYFSQVRRNFNNTQFELVEGTIDSAPAGTSTFDVAMSPNGSHLAVAHSTTPFVTIYSRSGVNLTKLANPSTLPPNAGRCVAWSPDSTYLVVGHGTTPFVTIYKRSGNTFTKLTNPTNLPAAQVNGAAFSADGNYLATVHGTSPLMTVYSRSGDTFTKITDPVTLPPSTTTRCAWSRDGTYLAMSHGSPGFSVYSFNGSTLTKIADPVPAPSFVGADVRFSPDGSYLAVAHAGSPYLSVYSLSGGVLTKLTNPTTLPSGTGNGCDWYDNNTVAVVTNGSTTSSMRIYNVTGSTITLFETPPVFGSGTLYPTLNSINFNVNPNIY